MKKTEVDEYVYHHSNKSNLLKDIENLNYSNNLSMDRQSQIIRNHDTIYINTWIGQCGSKYLLKDCSMYSNYEMYKDIYKQLSINIEDMEYYLPSIDFTKCNTKNIDTFLFENNNKKVLVCNGSVLSGQCPNFDLGNIIIELSKLYNNVDFILTNKINYTSNNIFFTDDIIKCEYSDLNEISYLSTMCDIIIGRASGPHAFTHIKDNYCDNNKTFLSLTDKILEGNWYNIDVCNQLWTNDYNKDNIINIIKNNL
jgi:hypothetical protein